jgi:hypothetical protein
MKPRLQQGGDEMATDKVLCQTPTPGKRPKYIKLWKYQAVRRAILATLDDSVEGVPFKDLSTQVATRLSAREKNELGSVSWYTTTVKLDLEVKGSRKNNFRILCADASCLAVLPECRNISICLHAGALPGRRLNT